MTSNRSFVRKVIYLGCIAGLLFPLYLMSAPEVSTVDPISGAVSVRGGGYLADARRKHNLAATQLGDVDPAGASMKLATLGLRGVAVNILWDRANEYKKTERWDDFIATLHQIRRLQPHFLTVWEFQAHNVSYNTSVEFDDYRLRYHWVKRGVDFLTEGVKYNRDDPKLLDYMGWVFGHKFGRSDEATQFRRLFRDDTDWHEELNKYVAMEKCVGPDRKKPDNWLVGREWYLKAIEAVETKGKKERGSPVIFFSHPVMSLINYAEAIEKEGHLDEIARDAWKKADQEWWGEPSGGGKSFGNREILSTQGDKIRLNDKERLDAEAAKIGQTLNELVPGVRERIFQERMAVLTPEQREAYETPVEKRNAQQILQGELAETRLRFDSWLIAEKAPSEKRNEARRLAQQIRNIENRANAIDRYREIVNFTYWKTRCIFEQTPLATDAHKFIFQASEAKNRGHLVASSVGSKEPGAKELYEKAFELYGQIYEKFPNLVGDPRYDSVLEEVERYRAVLGDLDEKFPDDFPLQALLDKFKEKSTSPSAGKPVSKKAGQKKASPSAPAKPNEKDPPAATKAEETKGETDPGKTSTPSPPVAAPNPQADAKSVDVKPSETPPAEGKASETKSESGASDTKPAEPKPESPDAPKSGEAPAEKALFF